MIHNNTENLGKKMFKKNINAYNTRYAIYIQCLLLNLINAFNNVYNSH